MRPRHWIYTIRLRVRSLFRKGTLDQELDEEMRFHLEQKTEEYVAKGFDPVEARRRAMLDMDGIERSKEECRDMRKVNWLHDVIQDLRYGVRMLRKNPSFTATAVLTLALGIGVNTAVFSVVNALMLRSLPVERPEELRIIFSGPNRNASFSNPLWEQLRERQDVFAGVFAWATPRFDLAQGGEVRYARGLMASGQFFPTLGVRPFLGRLLMPEDDRRGGENAVVVLSHEFWQREYGAGVEALGKTIHLDGQPFQIVGVTPPSFFGLVVGSRFDVAVPLAAEPIIRGENSVLDRPTFWWLLAAGRARPDLMPQQMDAHLATISRPAFEATVSPNTREPYRSQYLERVFTTWPVDTGVSNMRRTYRQAVWLLMGVVGMVLLIACANIANLLLARAAARQKEVGVRMALGASRRRLVRQLLTESWLLAAAGTVLAIPLASWAGDLLVGQIGVANFPVFLDLAPDWTTLTFVAGTALLTTLLFGLAPALRATRVSLAEAMKQAGPGESDRRRRFGLGRVLVVGQVAVSMVLLSGAALLLRSFHNLTALDTGFEAERVLIAELDLRRVQTRLESRALFYDELTERLRALPGVTAVSQADITPISGSDSSQDVQVDGFVPGSDGENSSRFNAVAPNYFAVMGTAFVAGRDFTVQDTAQAPRVAVVNEAFGRKFFPGRNPVGHQYFQTGSGGTRTFTEIVGLVRDAKYQTLREEPLPTVYIPLAQQGTAWWRGLSRKLVLRAASEPAALIPTVRAAIEQYSPQTAIQFLTLETQVADSLNQDRVLALLSGFFGGLALLLSSMGLYGLLAHSVARRGREIGIRMALGSTPQRILRMVLADGLLLAAIGVVVGVGAAVAATRVLASFLYGVAARDPLTLAAAGFLLVAVTAVACSRAARRAARVDPMMALRHE